MSEDRRNLYHVDVWYHQNIATAVHTIHKAGGRVVSVVLTRDDGFHAEWRISYRATEEIGIEVLT